MISSILLNSLCSSAELLLSTSEREALFHKNEIFLHQTISIRVIQLKENKGHNREG